MAVRAITDYPFFAQLAALPFVEAIYSFGSHAKGTAEERSDIDLVIFCPEASTEQWFQIKNIVESANVLVKTDVLRFDMMPNTPFKHYVNMNRVPLYVRDSRGNAGIVPELYERAERRIRDAEEAFTAITDEMSRAAAITKFVEAFRVYWFFVRRSLRVVGLRSHSPLSTFRQAMMEGWLENRDLWENLIEDFTYASGGLPDAQAQEVLHRVPNYLAAMRQAAQTTLAMLRESGKLETTRATALPTE